MRYVSAVLCLLSAAPLGTSFTPRANFLPRPCVLLFSDKSNNNNGASNLRNRSGLEGNQRQPTANELSIMDEMITKLAEAKPYELPNAVRRAFRVCSSPRFFMRIAERARTTADTKCSSNSIG